LAYVLEDGTQIYVPRVGENLENKEVISEEAGEGVINESVTEAEEKNIKVNINTANSEKLQTLPGVGPAMASKIIEYRNSKGKFKTIEDLKNVSGIGDNKFNKLKDYIVVN
jgi:competence protein ComEA